MLVSDASCAGGGLPEANRARQHVHLHQDADGDGHRGVPQQRVPCRHRAALHRGESLLLLRLHALVTEQNHAQMSPLVLRKTSFLSSLRCNAALCPVCLFCGSFIGEPRLLCCQDAQQDRCVTCESVLRLKSLAAGLDRQASLPGLLWQQCRHHRLLPGLWQRCAFFCCFCNLFSWC